MLTRMTGRTGTLQTGGTTSASARLSARATKLSGNVRWLWLLLIVAAWAVYPAITQNIGAVAYDAAVKHIYRSVVFSQAVSDGALYPRWVQFLHLGLGSPLFTFQPPLPYYGLDLLYRLGLAHPLGWRILIGGGLLLACAGAYALVYMITGQHWSALVAAAAYLYAPYVLRNSLERGSNEAFSMFLYPWVLWGLIRAARRPSAGWFIAGSLIWAGCIACHVLGPLMLAPVAGLLAIGLAFRYRTLAPLGVLLAGGLLTALVWAPMIPEQGWVHVERDFSVAETIPAQNPIPLERLLALPAVYDVARDNNSSGDRVGLLQTVLLLCGLPVTIYAWRRRRHELALYLGSATLIGLLLLWMFTAASDPVWRLLAPVLGPLLYRTRLMGVQALAVACVGGLALSLLPAHGRRYVGLAAIALLVAVALPMLFVDLQHHYAGFTGEIDLSEVRATEIRTGGAALTDFGEFTPRWQQPPFPAAFLDASVPLFDPQQVPLSDPSQGIKVVASQVRSSNWDLSLQLTEPATVTLHLLYYPRWLGYVDGQAVALAPQPGTGFAQLRVPAGSHQLALRYGSTTFEQAGLAISGTTLLTLLVAWGVAGLRRRRKWQDEAKTRVAGAIAAMDLHPPLWLLVALTGVLVFKVGFADGFTHWLRCNSTPTAVCGVQVAVDVPFPGAPRLRGYSVPTYTGRRGDDFHLTLAWQGEPGPAKHLRGFVHIRNSQPNGPIDPRTDSDIWAQTELETPGGLLTTDYVPGKLYLAEVSVPLPANMPPGTYFLEIGWYDPEKGEQVDPLAGAVQPPLKVLWRSILLPSVQIN